MTETQLLMMARFKLSFDYRSSIYHRHVYAAQRIWPVPSIIKLSAIELPNRVSLSRLELDQLVSVI